MAGTTKKFVFATTDRSEAIFCYYGKANKSEIATLCPQRRQAFSGAYGTNPFEFTMFLMDCRTPSGFAMTIFFVSYRGKGDSFLSCCESSNQGGYIPHGVRASVFCCPRTGKCRSSYWSCLFFCAALYKSVFLIDDKAVFFLKSGSR